MRTDSRLSRMLHVLLHMARQDRPISSEQIGTMLGTNAAVVRRTMAGLRKAGYVRAEKGRNGGWLIGCDLNRVTLLDVHNAVGGPRIFAIGTDRENPDCAVEKVVNAAIFDAMREAEALLIARLGSVTLAELATQFDEIATRNGYRFPAH
ncbi:Rrf2 family transcriptional regulator [Halomonas sp. HP20-15]|uniref:Rrf2 family transcriptional regulator n=1 Tax=Halomonas sp. HP20-15 TaxID=3085901 RepID=UPI0029818A96|nr:Rrf2 family transcriptional regulator [Halomonas sp. HP20-15]MDW5377193.1 Rrf2 family transcriptional regulator [Halomonas sp. HP20-15]